MDTVLQQLLASPEFSDLSDYLSRIATALEKRNEIESIRLGLYTDKKQVMILPKGDAPSPTDFDANANPAAYLFVPMFFAGELVVTSWGEETNYRAHVSCSTRGVAVDDETFYYSIEKTTGGIVHNVPESRLSRPGK